MMFGLVVLLHVLLSLFLIIIILLQGGRGGLGEALGGAAAQSLFGGSANIVMTKLTTVCAGLFMATCLSLAVLSTAKGRSVMEQVPELPAGMPAPLSNAIAPGSAPVTATTIEVPVKRAPALPNQGASSQGQSP